MNWERLWRSSGIGFVVFLIAAYVFYGRQPSVDASSDLLASFYDGHRVRILIASVIAGMAVINLLWFTAAISNTLKAAHENGWGAAVTTASGAVGAVFFVLIGLGAALTYSAGGSGSAAFTAGLHQVTWTCFVMSSFPRAMLTMAPTFGLWRAGHISNRLFYVGVGAVVLTLLGGTTWASHGVWAPDGAYSRFVTPFIGIAWTIVVSRVLLSAGRSTERAPEVGGERFRSLRPAAAGDW